MSSLQKIGYQMKNPLQFERLNMPYLVILPPAQMEQSWALG